MNAGAAARRPPPAAWPRRESPRNLPRDPFDLLQLFGVEFSQVPLTHCFSVAFTGHTHRLVNRPLLSEPPLERRRSAPRQRWRRDDGGDGKAGVRHVIALVRRTISAVLEAVE